MPSLTPQNKSDETVWMAMKEGFASGGLVMIPSALAVYAAMNFSPRFVKATNWSSRTALVIMPPLFAFAAAAESKLVHRMHEMASHADHSEKMAQWSQQQQTQQQQQQQRYNDLDEHRKKLQRMTTQKILSEAGMMGDIGGYDDEQENALVEKFRESVVNSGVRVVPGNSLGLHHEIANFWQENPFKILAGIGVPTILYIFKGREGQQHLQFQMKVMHTRVFGQFAVITMLLTLMGFKEYMDRSGKFITEEEVQARVDQMRESRAELLLRLQRDRLETEAVAEKRRKAHEADMIKSGEIKRLLKEE
ncbi:hypothetical protein ACHAXH_008240 [Discostella pseudostelligera]